MRYLIEQVRRALDAELYHLALFGALAVPDICAAMESEDGQTTGARYKAWFDRYVAPAYLFGRDEPLLNGADAWRLRCSMLHQGQSGNEHGRYGRVLFTEPGPNLFHANVMEDALNLDLITFCRDVVFGALDWLEIAETTATYGRNASRFLSRYPDGFPPYVVGVPVIT